jgi:hypothetical protein
VQITFEVGWMLVPQRGKLSLPMYESGDDPMCGHNKPSVLTPGKREGELGGSVAMIQVRP